MLVCLFYFACEAAGASSARHSLRPLFFWANGFCKTSGDQRRGNAESYLDLTSLRGAKRRSKSTSVIPGWSEGPDLRCAIAHRGISRFRVRCGACHRAALCADPLASPRNDAPATELSLTV